MEHSTEVVAIGSFKGKVPTFEHDHEYEIHMPGELFSLQPVMREKPERWMR